MADGEEKRPVRDRDIDPVPKIPRRLGLRWMWNDLFRIAFLLIMLAAIIALKDQCGSGIGRFIGSFERRPDAAPAPPLAPPGWELVPADQVDIKKMFPSGDAGPAGGNGNGDDQSGH